SGQAVEVVVGKPHPLTVQAALNKLGLPAERCLMVGDRLETDIAMGNKAGMKTALVLTGVSTRADVEKTAAAGIAWPDFVIGSVAEVQGLSPAGDGARAWRPPVVGGSDYRGGLRAAAGLGGGSGGSSPPDPAGAK